MGVWALVQIVMGASKPFKNNFIMGKGRKEGGKLIVSKLPRLFLVFTRIF